MELPADWPLNKWPLKKILATPRYDGTQDISRTNGLIVIPEKGVCPANGCKKIGCVLLVHGTPTVRGDNELLTHVSREWQVRGAKLALQMLARSRMVFIYVYANE